jgi:hypothetical protein
MHYRGFVIVDKPTKEAVNHAMQPFGGEERVDDKWDWYRCGGRYDGYLAGDDEMKRRETHDGFNFDDANESAELNHCAVAALPGDRREVYFFVADGHWVEQQFYVAGFPHGRFMENPEFAAQLQAALDTNLDKFVVVVDAHN